ncbi:hypothetical protein GCM10009527_042200 [Actinomadura nitritigenes]
MRQKQAPVTGQTRALHAYLRWRNTKARYPTSSPSIDEGSGTPGRLRPGLPDPGGQTFLTTVRKGIPHRATAAPP